MLFAEISGGVYYISTDKAGGVFDWPGKMRWFLCRKEDTWCSCSSFSPLLRLQEINAEIYIIVSSVSPNSRVSLVKLRIIAHKGSKE